MNGTVTEVVAIIGGRSHIVVRIPVTINLFPITQQLVIHQLTLHHITYAYFTNPQVLAPLNSSQVFSFSHLLGVQPAKPQKVLCSY